MAISTSIGSADYGLFDELAEEFAERYRRGERPSLQEYVDRCPEMTTAANPKFPAADWLVLALAHAKLKETDQARKAAALLKPTGARTRYARCCEKFSSPWDPTPPKRRRLLQPPLANPGEPPAAK